MKQTILVALIAVMVATPCLAQEVEPDGLFSLHGTKWVTMEVFMELPWIRASYDSFYLGFYNKQTYFSDDGIQWNDQGIYEWNSYVDLGLISFINLSMMTGPGFDFRIAVTPLGVGTIMSFGIIIYQGTPPFPQPRNAFWLRIGLMIKLDNDWTPPDIE